MSRNDLTAERLREVLHYEPETGVFTWVIVRQGGAYAGSTAGSKRKDGHIQIAVDRIMYAAHRIAWLYVNGEWPVNEIDHINGVRDDNRISNLRDVSHAKNVENRRFSNTNSKTGFLGVSPTPAGRFSARLGVALGTKCLGTFDTPEQAHEAYVNAKRELHEGCTL